MDIKKDSILMSEQAKHKKHCEYCGHTISFYAFEPTKKLCDWCGRYNYKNELVKFKYLLNKKMKEVGL
jgi:hypothetical protein